MSVAAPKTKRKTSTRKKAAPKASSPWLVVVHNDPVNLMSYVVLVFKKVLGFTEAKARKHMLEVHKKGRSVVWSGERERAEAYAHTLQTWQLSAQIEHSTDGK
jgi:ATP-dependent Clp protease adaptor protein ClpS